MQEDIHLRKRLYEQEYEAWVKEQDALRLAELKDKSKSLSVVVPPSAVIIPSAQMPDRAPNTRADAAKNINNNSVMMGGHTNSTSSAPLSMPVMAPRSAAPYLASSSFIYLFIRNILSLSPPHSLPFSPSSSSASAPPPFPVMAPAAKSDIESALDAGNKAAQYTTKANDPHAVNMAPKK